MIERADLTIASVVPPMRYAMGNATSQSVTLNLL